MKDEQRRYKKKLSSLSAKYALFFITRLALNTRKRAQTKREYAYAPYVIHMSLSLTICLLTEYVHMYAYKFV